MNDRERMLIAVAAAQRVTAGSEGRPPTELERLVLAAWSDLTDARACAHRAGRQYVLREGYQVRPGTRWLQVYEQTYPAVRL
jgi:hypothetical protein